ncbi:MAG: hypothetical protein JST_000104 [Candidatus Parcubacteria bacterium]|jgi:hypothetical protein|nr:MAG: hypothetical protein JST_0880 [Candidatus Parcubacteria bacterium]
MKLVSNKNLITVALLFLGVSFLVVPPAKANTCTWTKVTKTSLSTFMPAGSVVNPNTVDNFVCPSSTIAGNSCYGDKPIAEEGYGYLCCCSILSPTPIREPKFTNPSDTWQVKIPGLERLSEVDCSNGVCKIPWISEYSFGLYSFGLNIASILAVLILMAAGVIWIVSGGDQGKIATAKNMIMGSVTGLILLVGANLILSFINPDLVKLKSLEIAYIEPLNPLPDTDVGELGEIAQAANPYQEACAASRKGDYSLCLALDETQPAGLVTTKAINGSTVFIEQSVLSAYLSAMECVKEKNKGDFPFGINNAWRSPKIQVELRLLYEQGKGEKAAPPCCSNHGSGQAIDINYFEGKMSWAYNEKSGLRECMNANGLYANTLGEPWHWSPTGN